MLAESKVTTNPVMYGFPLLCHNWEPAPIVHGRGAEQEEQQTCLKANFPPLPRISLAHFVPWRKHTAAAAPQKSEFTGEASLSEREQQEGCTPKLLFFTDYLIACGNETKGFHLSQTHELCIQMAITSVLLLMNSA